MSRTTFYIALAVTVWVGATPRTIESYDLDAHQAITRRAIQPDLSRLERVLQINLGFPGGRATEFSDGVKRFSVEEWIVEGSFREDTPHSRVVNHFHNPLASSWALAGLEVAGLRGISSVGWQQHPTQDTAPVRNGPGRWGWPSARAYHHTAVTAPTAAEREIAFARLFRSLGQMVHLVQDASVPAHTRNDAHPTLTVGKWEIFSDKDPYEKWVEDRAKDVVGFPALLSSFTPVRPSDDLYTRPPLSSRVDRALAPAPVSALIDAAQYTGSNPGVTATLPDGRSVAGLAEYSNANFFSKDTMRFDADRPYPARTSLELRPPEYVPELGEYRSYLRKHADGDVVEFAAVASTLVEFLPDAFRAPIGLDERVAAAQAPRLLPRAIGYSAALLDHFLRGQMEVLYEPGGTEAIPSHVRITNRTPGETMAGTFTLYHDSASATRKVLAGPWALTLPPDQTSGALALPSPLPADVGYPWVLVFKGALGAEPTNAVVASVVGPRYYDVRLVRASFPGSECDPAISMDGSYAAPRFYGPPIWLFATKQDGVIVEHRTTFYDCDTSGGWIVEPGSQDYQSLILRTLAAVPGTRMTVSLPSVLYPEYAGCALWLHTYLQPRPPATVEVVELEPPASPAVLGTYSSLSPPTVRRVLGSVGTGGAVTFDVGSAQFLGVRLISAPPPPIFGPVWVPYGSPSAAWSGADHGVCDAGIEISFE